MQDTTALQRKALIGRMIGDPVPRLWCPSLTHYTGDGEIDVMRMAAHWRSLASSHVGGFLVPGSTGEGWEMTEGEVCAVVDIAIDLAMSRDTRLLIGILQTDAAAMVDLITDEIAHLRQRTGLEDPVAAMATCHVAGFTICPPSGAGLTQAEIRAGLARVLDLDLPVALYQLPQITGNEVSPDVFADLAAHYPNLMMFKDTSGQDRVPLADAGRSGVILMRGAEGDYSRWLREAGGCYDGFLLSTANSLAPELHQIISLAESGVLEGAHARSRPLTAMVAACFEAVAPLPYGNAFANANKAMDHWMAYGSAAGEVPPPMLHAGRRLPQEIVAKAGEILRANGLAPSTGYLA